MKLHAGLHLAYSTNVHRGETWAETFDALRNYTLPIRERVCTSQPFAIGLHLSNQAASELRERTRLLEFQRWLGQNHCYVATLNGVAFGRFHGPRVKEQMFEPDWASPERLAYTNLLFDLLPQLSPPDVETSVTTLPGSYKGFHLHPDELKGIRTNLWHCVEHIARVSQQTGRKMSLGLQPEPLGCIESSGETIHLFDRLRAEHPHDARLAEHLAIDYDTCHFAVEFEEPHNALPCLVQHGIRISKIHLSSALKVHPTAEARQTLAAFANDPYLRQVVVCRSDGERFIYAELREALAGEPQEPDHALAAADEAPDAEMAVPEWRVHFHVPLNSPPLPLFDHTADHALGILDFLAANPETCSQLEIELDTFNLLPADLQQRGLADHVAAEYQWTLTQLAERGLVQLVS